MKICSRCNKKQSLDQFITGRRFADGLQPWCNSCRKEYSKQYGKDHKAELAQYAKEWRTGDQKTRQQELVNARCKERWANDREYRERKNDQKRETNQAKYNVDPVFTEKHKRWGLLHAHKRRAIQHGLSEHHTEAEWIALCKKYNDRCVCCGKKTKLTLDHVVPLSLGGSDTIENIQPLCGSCNSKKHTKIVDYRK
jgi:5-methylcytosine-specific restriction endonuclease McrA